MKEERFLGPKEVILTFDDGPMPWITASILDTLDKFCTKATFFSVGRMALAYPKTVREIVARGHTLGAHTYAHPLNLRTLRPTKALAEIERGFAAVSAAAGTPVAPFFRFPGLSDNANLLTHLQQRQIATFSVDAVSNDSYIHDPVALAKFTLQQIEKSKGGIVLFHDIKIATAKALPAILTELKVRGYRMVHMRAKAPYHSDPELLAQYEVKVAKLRVALPATPAAASADNATVSPDDIASPSLMPFYGRVGPEKVEPQVNTAALPIPVTEIKPLARPRVSKVAPAGAKADTGNAKTNLKPTASAPMGPHPQENSEILPWRFIPSWSTELKPVGPKGK